MKSLLKDNMIRYFDKKGLNIVERGNRFADWMEARKAAGLWNYQLTADRVGRQEMNVTNLAGDERLGINFCTMDYLGLVLAEEGNTLVTKYMCKPDHYIN